MDNKDNGEICNKRRHGTVLAWHGHVLAVLWHQTCQMMHGWVAEKASVRPVKCVEVNTHK